MPYRRRRPNPSMFTTYLGMAAFTLIVIVGIVWSVYFYTHMSTLCHEFPFELDRHDCLPYNVAHLR